METRPGQGYPRQYQDQEQWKGGWTLTKRGKLTLKSGSRVKRLLNIFANPDMPTVSDYYDPFNTLNVLLDGTTITPTNNFDVSYFNDPTFNTRLENASLLGGQARYDTYTQIEHDLLHESPLVALSTPNARDFFSSRIGCQTYIPQYGMDLAALCERASGGRIEK